MKSWVQEAKQARNLQPEPLSNNKEAILVHGFDTYQEINNN